MILTVSTFQTILHPREALSAPAFHFITVFLFLIISVFSCFYLLLPISIFSFLLLPNFVSLLPQAALTSSSLSTSCGSFTMSQFNFLSPHPYLSVCFPLTFFLPFYFDFLYKHAGKIISIATLFCLSQPQFSSHVTRLMTGFFFV